MFRNPIVIPNLTDQELLTSLEDMVEVIYFNEFRDYSQVQKSSLEFIHAGIKELNKRNKTNGNI
jgi:hypothetical protein